MIRASGSSLVLLVWLFGQSAPPAECGSAFVGFDSRLTVKLIGLLPPDLEEPIGFEVTDRGPVLAKPTRLFALMGDDSVAIPLDHKITGVSVDATGRLTLQSTQGVFFVGRAGLTPVPSWSGAIEGRLFNSGQPSYIEAMSSGGSTRIGVRQPSSDRVLPIAQLDGELRAANWDRHGLLAVVGRRLVRWAPPGSALEQIVADSGLDTASGVCAFSPTRAIVSTRSVTLLYTGRNPTVVGGVGGLCRVSNGTLYLFDPRVRRVWAISNADGLGDQAKDLEHAQRLLRLSVTQGRKFQVTQEFSEAVRLIGCKRATEIAREMEK